MSYLKIESEGREAKVSEQKWTEQSQKRKASGGEVSDRISTELKTRDVWCCELGFRILPLINFVMLMRIFEEVLMMTWEFCYVKVTTLTAVKSPSCAWFLNLNIKSVAAARRLRKMFQRNLDRPRRGSVRGETALIAEWWICASRWVARLCGEA